MKKFYLVGSVIAFLLVCGLAWGYTEAIKAKNAVELEKIASAERIKADELKQEEEQAALKREQEEKDFDAKRKNDCLKIYETEGDKWNNVRGWRYSEFNDTCYIQYKDPNPKTEKECDELYTGVDFFLENALCKDGTFENSF